MEQRLPASSIIPDACHQSLSDGDDIPSVPIYSILILSKGWTTTYAFTPTPAVTNLILK